MYLQSFQFDTMFCIHATIFWQAHFVRVCYFAALLYVVRCTSTLCVCQVKNVVSGALDRLHYEKDPCVRYDALRKVWIYLHWGRTEEDFGMYIHVAVILILFMGNAVYWGSEWVMASIDREIQSILGLG